MNNSGRSKSLGTICPPDCSEFDILKQEQAKLRESKVSTNISINVK